MSWLDKLFGVNQKETVEPDIDIDKKLEETVKSFEQLEIEKRHNEIEEMNKKHKEFRSWIRKLDRHNLCKLNGKFYYVEYCGYEKELSVYAINATDKLTLKKLFTFNVYFSSVDRSYSITNMHYEDASIIDRNDLSSSYILNDDEVYNFMKDHDKYGIKGTYIFNKLWDKLDTKINCIIYKLQENVYSNYGKYKIHAYSEYLGTEHNEGWKYNIFDDSDTLKFNIDSVILENILNPELKVIKYEGDFTADTKDILEKHYTDKLKTSIHVIEMAIDEIFEEYKLVNDFLRKNGMDELSQLTSSHDFIDFMSIKQLYTIVGYDNRRHVKYINDSLFKERVKRRFN